MLEQVEGPIYKGMLSFVRFDSFQMMLLSNPSSVRFMLWFKKHSFIFLNFFLSLVAQLG